MRRAFPLSILLFALAAPLLAQEAPDAVAARSGRELACLRPLKDELSRVLELLQQARAQMGMAGADARARRDAAHAVETLEQQVRTIVMAMQNCVETPGPTPIDMEEATQHAAEVENDPLPTVDEARSLSDNVRVVSAQRVDGVGMVPSASMSEAMTRVGPRLDACYQRLVTRGALVRGQGFLVFSVDERGHVGRVETEGFSIEDRSFERCVRRAATHLRLGTGSDGGVSRYAYTLEFGPPEP